MKLKIRAQNRSLDRHPFIAVAYDRAAMNYKKKLVEVTRIEAPGGDPGEWLDLEVDWPTPEFPPGQLIWKAPPAHSLVWHLESFTFEGRPMIAGPGMFA